MRRLTLYIICLCMLSCIKEYEASKIILKLPVKSGIALPFGYKTFSLENYLSDSSSQIELTKDETGFLTLKYKGSIELHAQELFKFHNIISPTYYIYNNHKSIIYISDTNITFPVYEKLIDITLENMPNADLDSIIVEKMDVQFTFNTERNFKGKINVSIPGLTKNNKCFNETFNLDEKIPLITVQNSKLTFDKLPQNNMRVLSTVTLTETNEIIDINDPLVSFFAQINNIEYESIFGYFDTIKQEDIRDKIPVNFAKNFSLSSEGIFFEEPSFSLTFKNSFGVPIYITLKWFRYEGIDNKLHPVYSKDAPFSGEYYRIPGPKTYALPLNVSSKTIQMNDKTTAKVINGFPTLIEYSAITKLNRDNDTLRKNFIHKDSKLNIATSLTLPLELYIKNLVLEDTLDVDLENLIFTDDKNIESITFELNYENYYPIDWDMNLIFIDDLGNELAKIATKENFSNAGYDTDDDGIVDLPGKNMDPIKTTFNQEKSQLMKNATKLIIQGSVSTKYIELKKPVKFYAGYYMFVHLAFIIDTDAKL